MNKDYARDYATYNAILKPYLGEELEIGKMYNSPLPDHADSTASFTIYPGVNRPDNETKVDFSKLLFWKDWGYGKHLGHRPVHLLMHLHPGMTHDEALEKLAGEDFKVEGVKVKMAVKKIFSHLSSPNLSKRELAYWNNKYHIDKDLLRQFKVMGTRVIYMDNEKIYDAETGPATFTYLGPNGLFQLYRPTPKWIRRSTGGSFLLGYEQLPYKGRILLLLSGMKDGLCCYKATGWPFVAACGENDYHSYQPYMAELRERFDYIGVCQDPDGPGRQATEKLAQELGVAKFDFPYPDDKMDIADLMEKYGPAKLREAFYLKSPFKLQT